MGLLGKNEFHESTKELTEYEIRQMGGSKILFNFKKDCTFKHGDKVTNLIKARILEDYEKHASIAPDTAKYICFEIPTYISLKELANHKIFDVLNHIGKFELLMPNSYNNVGLIDKQENNEYELYKPTSEVLTYTRDVLDNEIPKNIEYYEAEIEPKESKKIIIPEVKEIKIKEEQTEKVILKPFLEEQFRYKIGNRVYANYKGIDTVDGKILNINRLGELKENEKQTIYSAFIQKVEKNKKNEIKTLQDTLGLPVLFTTRTKIEDISGTEDEEKITKFLSLVSDLPEQDENELTFIGGLDEEGKVIRGQENYSENMRQIIEDEKQRFIQEKQNEIGNS